MKFTKNVTIYNTAVEILADSSDITDCNDLPGINDEISSVDVPITVKINGETYSAVTQRGTDGEWDSLDTAAEHDHRELRDIAETLWNKANPEEKSMPFRIAAGGDLADALTEFGKEVYEQWV